MDRQLFGDITTVFVDLDDTIWDFTANSKVAMRDVYMRYGLEYYTVKYLTYRVRAVAGF